MSSTSPRYYCDECSQSFQRRAHLERHCLSHSKKRPFRCHICNKSFSRNDTLRRHITTHSEALVSSVKSNPRAARACTSCMRSKQRCSGNTPCDRCIRRGRQCGFPNRLQKVSSQTATPSTAAENGSDNQLLGRSGHEADVPLESNAFIEPVSSYMDAPIITGLDSSPAIGQHYTSSSYSNWNQASTIEGYPSINCDSILLWPLADREPGFYGAPSLAPQILSQPSDQQFHEICHESGFTPINSQGRNSQPVGESAQNATMQTGIRNQNSLGPVEQTVLPKHSATDCDILKLEDYCHVPPISSSVYRLLGELCDDLSRGSPGELRSFLPGLELLNVFVQLYFENFHKGFPILHRDTFKASSDSLLLCLAVGAIGSQYSRISCRATSMAGMLHILRRAFLSKLPLGSLLLGDLQLAQTALLFTLSLIFGGKREDIMFAQYQRNMLITMCRAVFFPGLLFEKKTESHFHETTSDWLQWIRIESWKRLVYFTWVTECLQWVIFDIPPLMKMSDLCIDLPCDDDSWLCGDAQEWENSLNMQPGATRPRSVFELMRRKDLNKEDLTSIGESALFITIFTAYAEERSLMEQLGPPPHRYSLIEFFLERLEAGTQISPQPLSLLRRQTDSLLEAFRQTHHTQNANSAEGHTIRKLSHVFEILRFVPYQGMYASSGWLTHQKDAEITTHKLAQRLAQEPERARHTLIHACQLFRLIRTQHLTDSFDSFFLLMATLYVWFYDRLIVSQRGIQNVRPAHMHILRIDQEKNRKVLDGWVQAGDKMDKQIHISGIGFLDGGESSPRVLKEAIRILSHDRAWSVQSNAIARSLQSMIAGISPSFDD